MMEETRIAGTTALPFIAAEGSIDMVCVCYPVREFVNVSAHSRIDEIFSGAAAAAERQGQGRFLACRPYLRMKVEGELGRRCTHTHTSYGKETEGGEINGLPYYGEVTALRN